MELLSPEKIKNDTSARIEEQRARVIDGATEETRITRSLNETREVYKTEMARLDSELNAKKKELLSVIEPLRNEVVALESRRAQAIIPIEDLRQEAQKIVDEAKTRLTAVIVRETAVTSREDDAHTLADKLDEIKDNLNAREKALIPMEEGLKHAARISKESQQVLAKNWLNYHNAVRIHEKSCEDKHLAIAEREMACSIREKAVSEVAAGQAIKETQIADKFQVLEFATLNPA